MTQTARVSRNPTELGRSLRSRHVSMIAIGGIIGAGLFVGSSTSIATVGPAVIITYAISGLVILMIMRMLSEMAMASPGTGTFTEFVRLGLGHGAGFVAGWLYWYFWVVVVPVEAIAGAVILRQWLPQFEVWQLGTVLLALMTGVNLLSTRSYGEVEFWLSSLKVGAIIVFILLGAAWACGFTSPTGPTFATLTAYGGFAPAGYAAVLAGVTSVIFSVVGAEISTIAAAESNEPAKTIAKAATSVALRILLFYILSIGLIVSILPWNSIVPGVSPFTATLVHMNIPAAATFMSLIVLAVIIGLAIAWHQGFGPVPSDGDAGRSGSAWFGPAYESRADPGIEAYDPRPEWYYFFLFELLRIFKTPELLIVGSMIIPTIWMILLISWPFLDRNPDRRLSRRPIALSVGALVPVMLLALTWYGSKAPAVNSNADLSKPGATVFNGTCGGCHTLAAAGTGGQVGPVLDNVKPDYATALEFLTNGKGGMPSFKAQKWTDDQLKCIAGYVSTYAGGGGSAEGPNAASAKEAYPASCASAGADFAGTGTSG